MLVLYVGLKHTYGLSQLPSSVGAAVVARGSNNCDGQGVSPVAELQKLSFTINYAFK